MKILDFIKNFWLDFFSAYHRRLMKNAKYETPISTVLHTSFVLSENINTLLILILSLFIDVKGKNIYVVAITLILIILINCYWFYNKFSPKERNQIINRNPKYKTYVYDLYSFLSFLLFVLVLFFVSKI